LRYLCASSRELRVEQSLFGALSVTKQLLALEYAGHHRWHPELWTAKRSRDHSVEKKLSAGRFLPTGLMHGEDRVVPSNIHGGARCGTD
jgi:hypothetical protein